MIKFLVRSKKTGAKKMRWAFLSIVSAIILSSCGQQVDQRSPTQQVEKEVYFPDGVSGFQTGSVYVLNVQDAGPNSSADFIRSDSIYVTDANKKFEIATKKLEKDGWILDPKSIKIVTTEYSAWINASFHKEQTKLSQ